MFYTLAVTDDHLSAIIEPVDNEVISNAFTIHCDTKSSLFVHG